MFRRVGISTTINLILTNVQFIALLNNLDVHWPESWSRFLNVFALFNIDPQDLIGQRELPLIDYRMLFILVSIILPLFINICILLLYQSMPKIAWYTTLTFGVVMFLAGALGRILPSSGLQNSDSTSNLYLIIGGSCVGLALLAFIIYKVYKRYNPDADITSSIAAQHSYLRKFHRMRALTQFGMSMLCLVAGLLISGLIRLNVAALEDRSSIMATVILAVGYFLLGLGGLSFLYFLVNLFAAGRRFVLRVTIILRANLLLVFLLILSASYIPTISWCLNMFMCTKYECPAGTRFNPYGAREENSYSRSPSLYCDPCDFLNSRCASINATAICPGFKGYRNWKRPEVACDDEAAVYYYFASGLVLLNYLLAIPYLYKSIIDMIIPQIQNRLKPLMKVSGDTEDAWELEVLYCRPAAASLYEPYWLGRRYYTLATLWHRLIIVLILVVVAPFSSAASVIVLAVHSLAFALLAYFRPLMNNYEMALAIALGVCNVLNGLYAVVVWRRGRDVPDWTTGVFIFLNVVVPITVSIIMKCVQMRRAAVSDREVRKREAKQKFMEEVRQKRAERERNGIVLEEPPADEVWHSDQWDSDEFAEEDLANTVNFDGTVTAGEPLNATVREGRPPSTMNGTITAAEPLNGTVREIKSPANDSVVVPVTGTEAPPARERLAVPAKPPRASVRSSSVGSPMLPANIKLKLEKKRQRKKTLRKESRKLEEELNAQTGTTLSKFFMVMGIFLFIALGAAVLGAVRQRPSPFVIGTSSIYRTTKDVLATYENWTSMTENCCCIKSGNPSVKFNLTERWLCANGKTLDRGRVTKGWVDNSLPFRALCSETTDPSVPSCTITTTGDLPKLACNPEDRAAHPEVSESAFTFYW